MTRFWTSLRRWLIPQGRHGHSEADVPSDPQQATTRVTGPDADSFVGRASGDVAGNHGCTGAERRARHDRAPAPRQEPVSKVGIPMPERGDVTDLILADHRSFEEMLHHLRDITQDRAQILGRLSALLVAHAEAEEREVYPRLRHRDAIDTDEERHSEHEHDEGHEALLALLEIEDPEAAGFLDAVEELSEKLHHHLDEEERDVLNPARTEVDEAERERLGENFLVERKRQLDSDCGAVGNVRRLVSRAHGPHRPDASSD